MPWANLVRITTALAWILGLSFAATVSIAQDHDPKAAVQFRERQLESEQLQRIWNSPGLAGRSAPVQSGQVLSQGVALRVPDWTLRRKEPEMPGIFPCEGCSGGYRPPQGSDQCVTGGGKKRTVPSRLTSWIANNHGIMRSVAVVEINGQKLATAFLAAPHWVATNDHVTNLFAADPGSNRTRTAPGRIVRLLFGTDANGSPIRAVSIPPDAVILKDGVHDLAVVRVDAGTDIKPLTLAAAAPDNWGSDTYDLIMIGFVAPQNDSLPGEGPWLDDMYIPCGAVRRVSALQAQIGRSLPRDFGRGAWEATYSFNTYGANSGSPVFNISGNQVVAIHGAEGKSSRLPNVGITVEKLRALIERAQMVVN